MPPAYFVSSGELGGAAVAVRTQPRQPTRRSLSGTTLWAVVTRHARCADGGLHPDQWFPVSVDPSRARQEAAAAIAVCAACPVRDHCLALSLRYWDIGQHGVWGGLIAADRARLRGQARPGRASSMERVGLARSRDGGQHR